MNYVWLRNNTFARIILRVRKQRMFLIVILYYFVLWNSKKMLCGHYYYAISRVAIMKHDADAK